MEISSETIDRASSSRFARLSVGSNPQGTQVVVCSKSFFSWAVHAIRYRFSSSYRVKEQELRQDILANLYQKGSGGLTAGFGEVPQDVPYGDRRGFNAYLIDHLGRNSDSAENYTADPQGETRVLGDSATPGNNKVPASDMEAKEAAGRKQSWPREVGVYNSFWRKQGSAIAKDGYENIFRFEGLGGESAESRTPGNGTLLFIKVTNEISEKFGAKSSVPSDVTCALSHILFTTPKGEQEGLFSHSDRIDPEDYGVWGFLGGRVEEGHCAHCRLPNERLQGAVSGLFFRHFHPGQSKEDILKGLDQDRKNAGDHTFRNSFQPWGTQYNQPLSEAELGFCVDAMENFANAYFDANSLK